MADAKLMEIIIEPLKQPADLLSPLPPKLTFAKNIEQIFIGREKTCDITLECKNKIVSRKHAQIIKHKYGYELVDLSANGTYANDNKNPIGIGKSIEFNKNIVIDIGDFKLNVQAITQTPKNKIEELSIQRSQKRKNLPIANITQSFIPPSVIIPEDWNSSPQQQKNKPNRQTSNNIANLIDNATTDTQLLNGLLKGLGLNNEKSRRALNKENMVAIGRCLRTSISGTIKQTEHVNKIKSKLCLDEKNSLKTLNYSSFGNISSTEGFLAELLNNQQSSYSHLPLEIARCQKEVTEDYAIILNSYNKAIDSFREELSPFSIESEFQSQTPTDASFTAKLVPSIGKWQMYKSLWSEKCLNFKKIIKRNFEENIKQAHIKRINTRPIDRKKQ